MQTFSFRIWTRLSMSISSNDNHYTIYVCMHVHICICVHVCMRVLAYACMWVWIWVYLENEKIMSHLWRDNNTINSHFFFKCTSWNWIIYYNIGSGLSSFLPSGALYSILIINHLECSDYYLHLYCNIHNFSAYASFVLLRVFHIELGNLD